jgi:hypothetical protein
MGPSIVSEADSSTSMYLFSGDTGVGVRDRVATIDLPAAGRADECEPSTLVRTDGGVGTVRAPRGRARSRFTNQVETCVSSVLVYQLRFLRTRASY